MLPIRKLAFFCLVLLLSQCSKQASADEEAVLDKELAKEFNENTIGLEYAFSKEAQKDTTEFFSCTPGSDMACKDVAQSVIADPGSRWIDQSVKFSIAPYQFTAYELSMIEKAMNEIKKVSCVTFSQIPSLTDDSVYIQKNGKMCAADTGRRSYQGSHQRLMVDSVCFKKGHGIIMHELLHILGFYHEHMRSDRDQWVDIKWERIVPAMTRNFNKIPDAEIDLLGQAYDYGSIMHYGKGDFATTKGLVTIQSKHELGEGVKMGQRVALTAADIKKLNLAYNCGGKASLTALPNKPPKKAEEEEEIYPRRERNLTPYRPNSYGYNSDTKENEEGGETTEEPKPEETENADGGVLLPEGDSADFQVIESLHS